MHCIVSERVALDAATWSKVGELLDEALAIADATERRAFVDRSCGGSTQLRDEVLSLLDADRLVDVALPETRWIDEMVEQSATSTTDPAAMIGQRLGAWRIDSLIAVGGMGAVYRGGRADESFEKTVAIKLLPRAFTRPALAARFDVERRILARLDHPGIARRLDGGTSTEGVPWLVMEYVEGVPMDRYCDEKKLPIAARLQLFAKLCDAVQYAHQHLVVHRDLKPGNIIVTTEGESKLLDFGIAAMLDAESASTNEAASNAVAMTPLWASPKQRAGASVTTASDIYSLGVLLYRLLAGHMPDSSSTSAADALPADLDAIVQMAMQKKPQDRYVTVAQLAEDIRRFLRQEPVAARTTSVAYRATRFAQRHRGAVALAGAGLLGIVLASIVALYQANRANFARERADLERARAERGLTRARTLANESLLTVYDLLRNVPGTTPARALVAEKVAVALDEMANDTHQNADLMREAGQSWSRLAIIQSQTASASTGEITKADASFRRAISLLASTFVAQPSNSAIAYDLVRIMRVYGVYLATHNRVTEAPMWLARAVTVAAAFAAANPDTRQIRMEASAAAASLAFYARPSNSAEHATRRAHALTARDVLEQLDLEPLTPKQRTELDDYRIYFYGTLARAAHTNDEGRLDAVGVLNWAQKALAIAQTAATANPDSAQASEQLATSLLDVSAAASELKQHELAAERAADAMLVREKLHAADRADPGRLSAFTYALASVAEAQAKLSGTSATQATRATLTKARELLHDVKPELRHQLDMITAEMGINAVSARLDGRAAANTLDRNVRAALCQSAENSLGMIRKQQARWEAFHQQSLTPELDEIQSEMQPCRR